MKRYLFLLIMILITPSAYAKVFNYDGNSIEPDVFSSGDKITNVDTYTPWVYFKSPYGTLAYINNNYPDIVTDDMKYTTDILGKNVFDIKPYVDSDLIIPTINGKKVIWRYENTEYDEEFDEAIEVDNFYPMFLYPEYELKCDNNSLKLGESTKCTLSVMRTLYNDSIFFNDKFDISSEDFEISNIEPSDYYSYSDGEFVNDFSLKDLIDNKGEKGINKFYKETNLTIHFINEDGSETSQLVEFNANYDLDNYYLTLSLPVSSFNITKTNNNIESVISFDNYRIFNPDVKKDLSFDNEYTAEFTSLIEEVKGVEEVTENPKTGIVHHTLLILLSIITLVLSYKFIYKKNMFKKI
ncbi:MAG: hypothetical protein K6C11_04475 [Bacilli bacterium]|nr:hypothetical protein [Bacilli bacterium]